MEFQRCDLFCICSGAGAVVLLTLPFEIFRIDAELLAELFTQTRVERATAYIELALRIAPWFVALTIFAIGVYLAFERRPSS